MKSLVENVLTATEEEQKRSPAGFRAVTPEDE